MRQYQTVLSVETTPSEFFDITHAVNRSIWESGIRKGILTLFIQHTSASLTIQENADPAVLKDLNAFFERSVPKDNSLYTHTFEGKDDMPAHIRSVLTNVSLSIPVYEGRMALGSWQAVYICEHREEKHIRNVILHLIGE